VSAFSIDFTGCVKTKLYTENTRRYLRNSWIRNSQRL